MLATDARDEWDPGIFDDPRAVDFWDEERVLGSWFADPANLGLDQLGPILWDAFLVFGPEARWDREPSPLVSVDAPVIGETAKLSAALRRVAQPGG